MSNRKSEEAKMVTLLYPAVPIRTPIRPTSFPKCGLLAAPFKHLHCELQPNCFS